MNLAGNGRGKANRHRPCALRNSGQVHYQTKEAADTVSPFHHAVCMLGRSPVSNNVCQWLPFSAL